MTWTNIRLELARTPDFPEGSPAHAYLLRLPLDQNGMVDADAYRAERGKATVQRACGARGGPARSGAARSSTSGAAGHSRMKLAMPTTRASSISKTIRSVSANM
jgi:hypothetical protein